MERLIDDLMALAQVTRTELLVVSVDLSAVCRDVLKDLREGDPGRQVEVMLDEGLGCLGDAGLLRRLMANLIGNAWKFTARTPDARIHIGRQPDGPAGGPPVFFVQNNGAGFDMKFAGRLFLPFERLHGDHDFPAPAWAWRRCSASWRAMAGASGPRRR
jgi:light-regulated signal transduction histidine kinase (bacteriophytochrome)